jgi:hypothetical protein
MITPETASRPSQARRYDGSQPTFRKTLPTRLGPRSRLRNLGLIWDTRRRFANRNPRFEAVAQSLGAGLSREPMGLEPSTFCMARTLREATQGARSRQIASAVPFLCGRRDRKSQQPTSRPSQEPSRDPELGFSRWSSQWRTRAAGDPPHARHHRRGQARLGGSSRWGRSCRREPRVSSNFA